MKTPRLKSETWLKLVAVLSGDLFKRSPPHLLSCMSDAVGNVSKSLLNVLLHFFDLSQLVFRIEGSSKYEY